MDSELELIKICSERSREVSLLVEVNGEGPVPSTGKANSQVESDRRFSTTTLRVGQRIDMRHLPFLLLRRKSGTAGLDVVRVLVLLVFVERHMHLQINASTTDCGRQGKVLTNR